MKQLKCNKNNKNKDASLNESMYNSKNMIKAGEYNNQKNKDEQIHPSKILFKLAGNLRRLTVTLSRKNVYSDMKM